VNSTDFLDFLHHIYCNIHSHPNHYYAKLPDWFSCCYINPYQGILHADLTQHITNRNTHLLGMVVLGQFTTSSNSDDLFFFLVHSGYQLSFALNI
jgi:hypothetical protein